MTSETHIIISSSLRDLIEKILEDKTRLRHIINSMTNNDSKRNINDKLIDNLDDLEFEDNNIQNAIEYLTLILSNMETQKIATMKIQNGEMIKILDHILDNVKHMEDIIKTVNNNNNIISDSSVVPTGDKKNIFKDTVLPSLTPKTGFANGIFWLSVFIILVTGIYELDKRALTAGEHMMSTAKTALKKELIK